MTTLASFSYNVYCTAKAEGAATTVAEARLFQGSVAAAASVVITSFNATGALVPALLSSGAGAVHESFFIGKDAFTVVTLDNMRSYLTKNEESDSDPLAQRRKAGWKVFFKAVINNNAFLAKFDSESAFDGV